MNHRKLSILVAALVPALIVVLSAGERESQAQPGGLSLTGRMGKIADANKMPVYTQPDGITCGPTSVSMVLKYYGKTAGIAPLKTACGTRFYEGPNLTGKPISVGLTFPGGVKGGIEAGLEKYGVPATVHNNANFDQVMNFIDKNRPVIMLVRSGWDAWHWIVVVGYYDDGASFVVHDPGYDKPQTLSAKNLQMGWDYSGNYHGKNYPNPQCNVCGGNGKVNAPNPNLECPTCSGSGRVKIVIGSGKFKVTKDIGTCKICGGSGRLKGELPKISCIACQGKGHFPEGIRAFVGTLSPPRTIVVPNSAPSYLSGQKIFLKNNSGKNLKVAVHYKGYEAKDFETKSWINLSAGEKLGPVVYNGNQQIYFYAESTDGKTFWRGKQAVSVGGKQLMFMEKDTGTSFNDWTMNFNK